MGVRFPPLSCGTPTRAVPVQVPPLPSGCTSALAGAVREALLNVEKHAQASSVLVSLFKAAEGVAVTIYDDGQGPPAAPTARPGLGLAAAADRLGQVAGNLRVGRNDDGGVTVRAWVPC